MASLARTYGRPITAVLWLLVAVWVVTMIVLPQLTVIERSLWWLERPEGSAEISREIDGLYNDVMLRELDLADAEAAQKPALAAEIEAMRARIGELEARETEPRRVYGLANYTRLSGLHLRIFVRTIAYAALVTLLSLAVCYPVAYAVAQLSGPRRAIFLTLGLVIPYAINELLRIYAWLMILDYQGVINSLLAWFGLVSFEDRTWVPFLEGPGAVFIAMVYAYVLFMVFPIMNTIATLDRSQIEAAQDLGAATWRIHWRVVIPHAKPGIAVGCIMVFMLSVGSYSVPQIMSRGLGGDWFSQLVYRQFFEAQNWNIGAAYAFSLLLVCLAVIFLVMRLLRVGVREIAR